MGETRSEPSMEDILASIKRIIAEDGTPPPAPRARRAAAAEPLPARETVLELTEPVPPADELAPSPAPASEGAEPVPELLSTDAASASRQSLAALSALVVRGDGEQENTLEALVRDLLRPVLKEWLDARLPGIVEGMVAHEIARITGRSL